jgi:hypothetical protein
MTPTPSDAQAVKRYSRYARGEIVEDRSGPWVTFSDHQSALDSERQKREAAERDRDEARQIVRDIFWMALRYADGRMTYAVGVVNDAVRKGYDGGWITPKDTGGDQVTPRFARDGMMPEWTEPVARAEAAESSLAKANARIAGLEAGWQPIETAPRDGTPVLVTVLLRDKSEAVVGEAHFEDRGDRDADTGWWWAGESPGDEYAEQIGSWHFPPSLWRPLPVPGNITNIEKERDDDH